MKDGLNTDFYNQSDFNKRNIIATIMLLLKNCD